MGTPLGDFMVGYNAGYDDGRNEGLRTMKDKLQTYICDLITARDVVATGTHPESNGPFGAAICASQKNLLDNIISHLEDIVED